jgi:hypothetical protein
MSVSAISNKLNYSPPMKAPPCNMRIAFSSLDIAGQMEDDPDNALR